MKQMKVIMLPYAGGSAGVYSRWKPFMPDTIQLVPTDIPGRGFLIKARPLTRVVDVVNHLLHQLEHELADEQPYALFGHSMGNLLAFELMHRLREEGKTMPICAFLTGRRPPHRIEARKRYELDESELIQEMVSMGGTTEEVLKSRELMRFIMPILRADFEVVDTYVLPQGREPLDVPFVIMSGTEDQLMSIEDMQEWKHYTRSDCTILPISGGHFFVLEQNQLICRYLQEYLGKYVNKQEANGR